MTERPDAAIEARIDGARQVLRRNWRGGFTRPAPRLYPHQWNWDTGFIAIGRSLFDPAGARREISTLFAAQWRNGMLPHIRFDDEALGE